MALTVSQKFDAIERSGGGYVNTYTITDTSNYLTEGLSVNDYVGVFRIAFEGLVIYNNSDYDNPDLMVGLGSKSFPLVLDSNGLVKQGVYEVTLSVRNKDTLVVSDSVELYTYNYQAVTISIEHSADGYNSTFTSYDSTNYGSLTVSRSHSVEVPLDSGMDGQATSGNTITYSPNIWSGDYKTTIVSSVIYTNGLLTVSDRLSNTLTTRVYYLTRDSVFNATEQFNNTYNLTIGTNPVKAKEYQLLSTRISGYYSEYQKGVEENDGEKCYNALIEIALLLSPDFISDLFVTTEEIIPFDFRPESEAEVLAFIQSLTATATEINKLHGLTTSNKGVVVSTASSISASNEFTYDSSTKKVNIPFGGSYNIDGVPIEGGVGTLPEASTTEKGIVQLSNAYNGTSQILATTEIALKTGLEGKQDPLVSGSNIKTINSESVLGSGDLGVQPILVSGSNIKTVNGNSLLGSGNLSVGGVSGSVGTLALFNTTTSITSSNVYQDSINSRIGIFKSSPSYTLDVAGLIAGTNLKTNTTTQTTKVGYQAGNDENETALRNNTFIGYAAGKSNTTATSNTFVGAYAGNSQTTNGLNTCVGYEAGKWLSTGYSNICIGKGSGSDTVALSTGQDCVLIGNGTHTDNSSDVNSIVIGSGAVGLGSNTTVIGNEDVTKTVIRTGSLCVGITEDNGFTANINGQLHASGINFTNGITGTGDVYLDGDKFEYIDEAISSSALCIENGNVKFDLSGIGMTVGIGVMPGGTPMKQFHLRGQDANIRLQESTNDSIYDIRVQNDEGYFAIDAELASNALTIEPSAGNIVIGGLADEYFKLNVHGNARIGTGQNTSEFESDGKLRYNGTARKKWTKYTANSITLTNGTSGNAVSDLQTMSDGTFYDLTEAASTPGINLIVDFISVTAFETVRVLGGYNGSSTHSLAIQVYNWNSAAWNTFNAMQTGLWDISTAGEYILGNYQFTVFDDANYIGTGGDAGKVRIRFYHTMAGNASHHLYIDEVSLRQ